MAKLSQATQAALCDINALMKAKTARDRADCLKIGEAWFKVKNDPAVERGDLKKLAPDFHHHPDYLQRHMRLFAEQHLLADADSWAAAQGFVNDHVFEPFRSLKLLRVFKDSLRDKHIDHKITRSEQSVCDDTDTSVCFLTGDCRTVLQGLDNESFHCCVTSPPYFQQRDYKHLGQIGLESTVAEYVFQLVLVFREVKRVLRKDGVCFIVIDDRYAGRAQRADAATWFNNGRVAHAADPEPCKGLVGVPDILRTALRGDGWLIRSNVIWQKNSGAFESVRDRPTHTYETVIMLTKSAKYPYNAAVREPREKQRPTSRQVRRGQLTSSDRNINDVWAIAPETRVRHPAPFPVELAMRCMRLSCPPAGHVLEPFSGSGTVGVAAKMLSMRATLIELNADYAASAEDELPPRRPLNPHRPGKKIWTPSDRLQLYTIRNETPRPTSPLVLFLWNNFPAHPAIS